VILFADKNVNKIEDALNKDMGLIGKYCEVNELLLNLKKGKTKSALFCTPQRLNKHGRKLIVTHNGTCYKLCY